MLPENTHSLVYQSAEGRELIDLPFATRLMSSSEALSRNSPFPLAHDVTMLLANGQLKAIKGVNCR